MASIYRRGNIWYVAWHDETGKRRYRSTGEKQKRRALQYLQEEKKPILRQKQSDQQLIRIWLHELKSLGRTTDHIQHLKRAITYLGTKSHEANMKLGAMDRSDQTITSYHRAAKQWGRWCYLNGHRTTDPMLGLRLPTRKTGRVYVRGVFTEEEAMQLSAHHMLYRVSLATGLRLGELRKLTNEHKKLVQGKHCLWLKPRTTKNRFEDIIPISKELWDDLELPMWVPSKSWSAEYLRRDLKKLGLPIKDQDGNPRDWHSLRGTFSHLLLQQGVSIPVVARRMRHSDGGGLLLKRYAASVASDIQ